ncbi:hypothetical protein [Spiroplasma endosymbiont of Aspidapion aeneum]|uniref:hypothetical protein n=1 Tax=Spiroplasma endosymbiont of Aspidapion aeneum TaxID=3066276 RepID=UPI00313AFFCD
MKKFLTLLSSLSMISLPTLSAVVACRANSDEDTKILDLYHLKEFFYNPILNIDPVKELTQDIFESELIVNLNTNVNKIVVSKTDLVFEYFDEKGNTLSDSPFKGNKIKINDAQSYIYYSVSATKTSKTVTGSTNILQSSIYSSDYNPKK